LWNSIFKGLDAGFFVEVGANRPISNSNTLFLEDRGWNGISFDPLVKFSQEWKARRRAKLYNVAISSKRGEREFTEFLSGDEWQDQLSGFSDGIRSEDLCIFKHRCYPVKTAPLSDYIPEGICIDLLLIDTEGAERAVLDGINFKIVRPLYILIENDSRVGGDNELRKFVCSLGYDVVARIGLTDDLFRRSRD
jgi:FkbM family methyltransferase